MVRPTDRLIAICQRWHEPPSLFLTGCDWQSRVRSFLFIYLIIIVQLYQQ